MAFHHHYKALSFARTKGSKKDLERNTGKNHKLYGTQKI